MNIKVMSFNTQHCKNYITREIDYDAMVNAIRTCEADIVGLNEMYGAGEAETFEAQVQILAEKLGYHYYFAKAIDVFKKESSPYGNGLISRFPIKSAETIKVPDPAVRSYKGYYESRCLLKATIDVEGGLTVCVSHFGLNPDEQENAVATLVSNLEPTRCIAMGDYNVTPEKPVLTPIRDVMFDTAELFDGEKLSFPSDEPRCKIDYIFTSRDLNVLSADIPAIVASDHRPHTIEVEL